MNRGFALTEFIISIIILSLLVTIGFTCYNHYIAKITGIIDELQVQGNVRYAADFINNLLIESAPSDIRIYDGPSSSNKLRIGKTFFQLIDNELKVNHEITNPSSRDNPLASYI
ncbi:MAG: prepilin-type N-terminal cleavage/methylation domain-containing protein, partial [Clostridiales bacterium]|nr:prepilin-type N-terminal cleavage/methylation domain-containing protein [Clostridiales bacterium]